MRRLSTQALQRTIRKSAGGAMVAAAAGSAVSSPNRVIGWCQGCNFTTTSVVRQATGSMGPSGSGGKGFGGNPPPKPPSGRPKKLGSVNVNVANFKVEVKESDVPTILYFHVETHPDVVKYSDILMEQVERANKDLVVQKMGKDAVASGMERIGLKLAMVDVERDPAMAQQFGVSDHSFPLLYFLLDGEILDRMIGMVPEAQVKDAINAFMEHCEKYYEEKKASGEGGDTKTTPKSGAERLKKMDNDEENVLTLLQAGATKLRDNDMSRAEYLFEKAYRMATEHVEKIKKDMNLHLKKQTPETMQKLKKDPHYNACPQALCGMALCALGQKKEDRARELSKMIRKEYPWACAELKEVAEAVCKIDIVQLVDFNTERDSYASLLKSDAALDTPEKFYNNKMKLSVAHYMEHQPDLALEECLKLIRAEPKMRKELKAAGIIKEAEKPGEKSPETPAKRLLFLIMESLGPNHEATVRARKKMAAFMHV